MARIRIKICGVRTVDDALAAANSGADAVGLMFVSGSPRMIDGETAMRIVQALPAMVEPVGVFVDMPHAEVRRIALHCGLRTIQLHGREGPGYVRELTPMRIIKSLPFDQRIFSSHLAVWHVPCPNLAATIVDAPPPDGSAPGGMGAPGRPELAGGQGRTVNWRELAGYMERGAFKGLPPMILSGGLDSENVGEAIRTVRPWGVDVSSGVELMRGIKSAQLIEAFCCAVRQAETQLAATPIEPIEPGRKA
ncbi:MAG: phosphoribosylanthranilate isomerase [Phycisphaeraceae bacterium]|nr:phosphoribosylanthranilate isomerase [Phycisphaeraceae bacterium]